jgi:hypothetical protein
MTSSALEAPRTPPRNVEAVRARSRRARRPPMLREVAHHAHDGYEILLLYDRVTGELTVRIFDQRSGARFDVAVGPHEAVEVFNHPVSYMRAEAA